MTVRDTTSSFQINACQFMRKFEERDRVVIVRADLMLLPTSGLRFRDRVVVTISRVKSGSNEASVVKSRYEVNAETDDELGAAANDLTYAQQFLLQHLSGITRSFEQKVQTTLMMEDARRRSSRVAF